MPVQPSRGAHRNRRTSQEVRGRVSSVNRRPASRTSTRYPFSVSRRAATDPPNPEPTTTTSASSDLSGPASARAGDGRGDDVVAGRAAFTRLVSVLRDHGPRHAGRAARRTLEAVCTTTG
ncbi:hypothetical protein CPE01_21910 [Cellulomonas persica]|uniref:Uncharacterized protein n=1 Tax=Cellulomonas persica TaxID=76861 RepID=A0A510UUX5_9CELL|nr:hypothetical protein CPE01_21910 [Cellulomonas persica]